MWGLLNSGVAILQPNPLQITEQKHRKDLSFDVPEMHISASAIYSSFQQMFIRHLQVTDIVLDFRDVAVKTDNIPVLMHLIF